jgi:hypothetical protein
MSDTPQSGLDADIARIVAMRDAGTITADEAERLIKVLRDVADVESDLAEPPAADAPATSDTPSGRDEPPVTAAAATPAAATPFVAATGSQAGAAGPGAGPTLTVSLLAGDLTVESGDVEEPTLRGDTNDLTLQRHGDGWRLDQVRTGWLERIPPVRVGVVVPRRLGVALDVKAGDVRIRGVRAVTGKMLAGDLDIDGAEAIDLQKTAGDLDARLRLTSGTHRIVAKAGDVEVRLLDGSDVAVAAEARVGDVAVPRRFEATRRGVGASATGRIGAGAARLDVRLTAGRVRIQTEEDHG